MTLWFAEEAFTDEERRKWEPVPQRLVRRHEGSGRLSLYLASHAGAIDGILDRIREEAGEIQVFATGGFSDLIVPLCRTSMRVVPTLTLDGLVAIARRLGLWQPPA